MKTRTARVATIAVAWLAAAVIVCTLAVLVPGCMRQQLDLSTAQVLHVARVELGSAAKAYDADLTEGDQYQFHAAMEAAKARMKADSANIDETMAAVELATHKYARDRQTAANRLSNVNGYLELLREAEYGFMDLYNRTNSLKGMFTGQATPPLTIPEAPPGTPPTPAPR